MPYEDLAIAILTPSFYGSIHCTRVYGFPHQLLEVTLAAVSLGGVKGFRDTDITTDIHSEERIRIRSGKANEVSAMVRKSNEVLNYIYQASQSRKKSDGKKEVLTPQMTHAATTFKRSMETSIVEWEEMAQHISLIQEICKREGYKKEDLEFLIEFLSLKCDFTSIRVIQTKAGGFTEILGGAFAFVLANADLAVTVNNYKYWILTLQQVLKTIDLL